jgi:cellulose synthase/poly-beta-1,6-N-acetylglucosamine synthase-like glycosyltransferase
MIALSMVLMAFYVGMLLVLALAWLQLSTKLTDLRLVNEPELVVFSIIIPVRNEGECIGQLLRSIDKQAFDKSRFEVLVVDDDSKDDTVSIIEDFARQSLLNIVLLKVEKAGLSPKKRAITQALSQAIGKYVISTDGDCVWPPLLLSLYFQAFSLPNVQFISGPVTFLKPKGWGGFWQQLQTVEFASLIGSAAASIRLKHPNMCSGANLGYRKSVFEEVGGFAGNMDLASGDDEFLMHKVFKKYPEGVIYLQNSAAVVETQACKTVSDFYKQRKRWASKWRYYEGKGPQVLAIFVFFVNLATVYLFINKQWEWLTLRWGLEFLFLGSVLVFLRRFKAIVFIPLVQLIYPFYVLFFGVSAFLGTNNYRWKDRILK